MAGVRGVQRFEGWVLSWKGRNKNSPRDVLFSREADSRLRCDNEMVGQLCRVSFKQPPKHGNFIGSTLILKAS